VSGPLALDGGAGGPHLLRAGPGLHRRRRSRMLGRDTARRPEE